MPRLIFPLVLFSAANACTDVLLTDPCNNNAVVSGRTLSFPLAMSPEMVWAPAGSTAKLFNVAPGVEPPSGRDLNATYSSVCITMGHSEFRNWFNPEDPEMTSPARGWCVDGMNELGLTVSVLYQQNTLTMPSYNATSSKQHAINVLDFGRFMLSQMPDVPTAQAYLENELQLTWNTEQDHFGIWFAAGATNVAPIHFSIHDAEGRSLSVQIRDNKVEALLNPLGVFTNMPFLQEQYENYELWKATQQAMDQPNATLPPVWGFVPMPGDYSAQSRFVRLAMAKEAALRACWSNRTMGIDGTHEKLSPAYLLPGMPSSNPALLTVMQIENTGYLPRGITDTGAMAGPDVEFTPWSVLRDHNATVYYYRSGNNPVFKAFDLKRTDWQSLGGTIVTKPLSAASQAWFVDATNEFQQQDPGSDDTATHLLV